MNTWRTRALDTAYAAAAPNEREQMESALRAQAEAAWNDEADAYWQRHDPRDAQHTADERAELAQAMRDWPDDRE